MTKQQQHQQIRRSNRQQQQSVSKTPYSSGGKKAAAANLQHAVVEGVQQMIDKGKVIHFRFEVINILHDN